MYFGKRPYYRIKRSERIYAKVYMNFNFFQKNVYFNHCSDTIDRLICLYLKLLKLPVISAIKIASKQIFSSFR